MTPNNITELYSQIGEKIKAARVSAQLKQDNLASLLNLSRASIVNIEKGRQHPSVHLLYDIAEVLNIKIATLLPSPPAKKVKQEIKWEEIIGKHIEGNNPMKKTVLGFISNLKK